MEFKLIVTKIGEGDMARYGIELHKPEGINLGEAVGILEMVKQQLIQQTTMPHNFGVEDAFENSNIQ